MTHLAQEHFLALFGISCVLVGIGLTLLVLHAFGRRPLQGFPSKSPPPEKVYLGLDGRKGGGTARRARA